MRKLLVIVTLIPFMVSAQQDWREQPIGFGIGVGVGLFSGKRIPPVTLGLGLAMGKVLYDTNRGKLPQPFTIGYGGFMASTMRIELRKRRELRIKEKITK